MPPVMPIWRLNSATAASNTPTSGLDGTVRRLTQCLAGVAPCERAREIGALRSRRLISLHLERMTAQESTLKAMSRSSAVLATGPV